MQKFSGNGLAQEHFNQSFFPFLGFNKFIYIFNSFLILESTFVNDSGYTISFWASGMMTFGLCVVVVNLKILMISNNHSYLSIFVILMSLLSYLLSIFIASILPENSFYKILGRLNHYIIITILDFFLVLIYILEIF